MRQEPGDGIDHRMPITKMNLTSHPVPMNPPDSVVMPLNLFQHTSKSMRPKAARMGYQWLPPTNRIPDSWYIGWQQLLFGLPLDFSFFENSFLLIICRTWWLLEQDSITSLVRSSNSSFFSKASCLPTVSCLIPYQFAVRLNMLI